MSDETVYQVPDAWAERAWVDNDKYIEMYQRSVDDPDGFWREHGHRVDWITPFTKVKNTDYNGDVSIKWFEDGRSTSAQLPGPPPATPGEPDGDHLGRRRPGRRQDITYREAAREVCKLSNALKTLGVKKGDRVTIYMPMIPEAAVAMLACARIGADPFGRLRRLLPRCAGRPHPDCDSNSSSPPTRACAAAARSR